MTWNKEHDATDLLRSCVETLRIVLPSGWRVRLEPAAGGPASRGRDDWHPDGVLRVIGPSGERVGLWAAARRRLEPAEALALAARMARVKGGRAGVVPFVAAGYLGERTRWLLAERGIGYADRTGNLRLASERPVLYLERSGARRDPSPDTRPIRTLRGSSSGRAVRALLDHAPPYGVRALAQRAGVSAATLSRVVELLEREAIAVRERARGPVTALDWRALLRRWSEDYSLVGSNRTATYLDPRGGFAASRLRGSSARYAVTGSAAAAVVAPVAVPRLTAVYVPSIEAAAEGWSLQRAETGGNVLLVEPCDGVVFERTTRRDGVTHAALGQVAIDLMTGPGRGPAEADALIAWMAAHEGEWRG
jgi:hypothetical protein